MQKKQTSKHFILLLVSNVYEFYTINLKQRKIRRSGGNYDSPRNMSFTHIVVHLPSRVQLRDLMDDSTPGLPHHLPKFAQAHVHCISDANQPSHPLTPSSPSALNLCKHQGLFQWVSYSNQVIKILELSFSISPSSEYSGLISLKIDGFDLLAVKATLKSLLQHHS